MIDQTPNNRASIDLAYLLSITLVVASIIVVNVDEHVVSGSTTSNLHDISTKKRKRTMIFAMADQIDSFISRWFDSTRCT